MAKRYYAITVVALICLGCLVLTSCTKQPQAPQNDEKKNEFAQVFMQQLRDDILPYREQPEKMMANGVLVTSKPGAAGTAYLDEFYALFSKGEQAELTIAFFSDSPLVVVRLVFSQGEGYYFRYEIHEDQDIAVTSKHIDSVEVLKNQDTKNITLDIKDSKKTVATFVFKPIEK